MKKFLCNVVIIACIFSGMKMEPLSAQCYNCGPGTCDGGSATGVCASALGESADADGDMSVAIGHKNLSGGEFSLVFGNIVETTHATERNMTIGMGIINSSTMLSNSISNSMMIGMNSNLPTLFIEDGGGLNHWGRVGIGTTAPQGILHVRDENGDNTNLVIDRNGTAQANLLFNSGGTTPIARIGVNGTGANHLHYDLFQSGGSHIFYVNTSNEAMRIIGNTANVAIGSQTASGRLHVNHATANTDVVIQRNGSNAARLRFHDGATAAGNLSLTSANDLLMQGLTSDRNVIFNVNRGGTNMEVMRIVGSNARVGIGTTGPVAKLEVMAPVGDFSVAQFSTVGAATNSQMIRIGNSNATANYAGYILGRSDQPGNPSLNLWAETDATGDSGPIPVMQFLAGRIGPATIVTRPLFSWRATGVGTIMEINPAGNIGMGTISPTSKLTVAGDIAPSANNSYNLGTSTANRWNTLYYSTLVQGSDDRIKENIQPLPYGLEHLLQLVPISYELIPPVDSTGAVVENAVIGTQFGLSAQSLLEVLPQLVSEDGDSLNLLGVRYVELIPVLINAIREQQTQIQSLSEQMTEQQSHISNCCGDAYGYQPRLDGNPTEIKMLDEVVLFRNDPNPFSEWTDIRYRVEDASSLSLVITDASGRIVKRMALLGLEGTLRIFGSDLSSGQYFYSLLSGKQVLRTERMVVTR